LHNHCKPYSLEAFTQTVRLPKSPAENFPGARAIVEFARARAIIESSLEPPHHRQVLLRASALSFLTTVEDIYAPPSSPTQVGDAIDHVGGVPKPVTRFLSLQQRCPP
jgi:hypothetical protein